LPTRSVSASAVFGATERVLEDKVSATPAALQLIEEIVREHGPVLFHQSGGCCDGSSPMCYPRNEFIVGDTDVLLGHVGGAPVYISASQFEAWKHTDLIIDVVPGRGGMFSLDNGREVRFLTRSKLCSTDYLGTGAPGRVFGRH
jgi:uncharacterized protein